MLDLRTLVCILSSAPRVINPSTMSLNPPIAANINAVFPPYIQDTE